MIVKRGLGWIRRKRRNREMKRDCIDSVVEATGCSRKEAAAQIKDARRRLDISYLDYRKMKMFHYSPEEQDRIYPELLRQKEEKAFDREACKEAAAAAMKWTMEEAAFHVDDTHYRHGIRYKDYLEHEIYSWPEEKILEFGTKAVFDRNKKTVGRIMKKTGWSREEAFERFADTRKRTGCRMKEFYIYRMYELTDEEQEKVFLVADSRKIQKKYDKQKFSDMLMDKEWSNNYFSEYLGRAWCINTNVTFEEFREKFDGVPRVIYKPAFGSRGKGTEAVSLDPENLKEAFDHITSLPDGVVEEFVKQHPDMNKLTPASVNTIRIVTVSSNEKPVTPDGKKADIAYAAVRIGGGSSIVDNFHSGGVVAAVDLENGVICTDAADMKAKTYKTHPATGTVFKGFVIPCFKEAKELVYRMIEEKEVEGYIGWDIAISEDGPVLIEVNTQPGAVLISTPYAAEHKGMKPVMEKYMID
ncbi:MAG: hypothetical protein IIY39_02670 [Firmicutes bacterium]|nr:hypothetical protein [Bacillota bacterium]